MHCARIGWSLGADGGERSRPIGQDPSRCWHVGRVGIVEFVAGWRGCGGCQVSHKPLKAMNRIDTISISIRSLTQCPHLPSNQWQAGISSTGNFERCIIAKEPIIVAVIGWRCVVRALDKTRKTEQGKK